jgi:hypothetical protein
MEKAEADSTDYFNSHWPFYFGSMLSGLTIIHSFPLKAVFGG